ncbi:MAG: O-antigen ligase family protein, partial [Thermoleophilaceae bacterium]|nr:O-antigen ligase family protein [Thermoleophilaceae bacterium]
SGSQEAILLMPAAAGSAGMGVVAAQAPLVGAGAGALTILTLMPWRLLFVLMTGAAILNRFRFDVAGVTLQPAHLILVPVLLRVLLFMRSDARPRWRWPETVIVLFIAVQFVSSYLFAEVRLRSLLVAGLLLLGALAYLAVYFGVCDRKRLIFAARALLIAAMANSAIALLAVAAYYTVGSTFGVSVGGIGAPAAGLAAEYNILGSMSASAALAFVVLMREDNPLFPRRYSLLGFWLCTGALVASLTRGAWIAFAVGLLASLLIRRRATRRNRLAQIGLTSLALGVGLLGLFQIAVAPSDVSSPDNAVVVRAQRLLLFTEGSGQNRVSEWQTALGEIPRSPILGLGTNSYGQRHAAPKKRPSEAKGAYIGNLYIRTLYDSGVVGLVLLLTFLAAVLWPKRIFRVSRGDLAPVAWALMFMYFTMGVAFVATDASFQLWPWIVLGMTRAARSLTLRQELVGRVVPGTNGDGEGNGHRGGGNGHRVGSGNGRVLEALKPDAGAEKPWPGSRSGLRNDGF